VIVHGATLASGGYRARGRRTGPSLTGLALSAVLALFFCGLTLLIGWIRWRALAHTQSPGPETGGGAGASGTWWTWPNVVAAAALGIAALRLLAILLGEKPRLARAARFVLVCAPFGVAWRLGSPLWLDSACGVVVALAATGFSPAVHLVWWRFVRDLVIGGAWAGAVHVFWWNWRYGLGSLAALVLAVFVGDRAAKVRRRAELRAIARRVSYSSTGKKCVACGKEVPSSSTVGGTCPHCGRVWGATVGAR
jgi:hypothetical protein